MNQEFNKDLNHDNYWPHAEQLINKHFHRKLLIRRSVYFGLIIVSVTALTYFSFHKNNTRNSESGVETSSNLPSIISSNNLNTNQLENKNLSEETNGISSTESNSTTTRPENGSASTSQSEKNINSSSEKNIGEINHNQLADSKAKNQSIEKSIGKKESLNHQPVLSTHKNHTKDNQDTAPASGEITSKLDNNTALGRQPAIKKIRTKKTDDKNAIINSTDSRFIQNELKDRNRKYSDANDHSSASIAFLPAISPTLSSVSTESGVHEKNIKLPVEKTIFSSWYVNVYALVSGVNSTLQSTMYNRYVERRKAEENPNVTPGFGISGTYRRNKLSITTGVELTKNSLKTAYSSYTYQDVITQNSSWQTQMISVYITDTAYINGMRYYFGRTENILDSSYVTINDTSNQKVTTPLSKGTINLTYIEIPLQISYQLAAKRIGLGITAGVSPAFLMSQKGSVLKSDESGVQPFSESGNFKKVIWNARFGIEVNYYLSGRTSFLLSPQFRTNTQSVYESGAGYNQRYYSVTVVAGFRYLLK